MAGNAATLVLNWVRRHLPEDEFFEPLDIVIRRCFSTTFSLEIAHCSNPLLIDPPTVCVPCLPPTSNLPIDRDSKGKPEMEGFDSQRTKFRQSKARGKKARRAESFTPQLHPHNYLY